MDIRKHISHFTLLLSSSSLGLYQLVRPASPFSAMPEHHTCQVTTDKLEEAVKTLPQDNFTLNTKIDTIHASLTAKIEALFDRFAAIVVNSPLPPPLTPLHTSSSPHRHHMKLEVPRFDDHDPLGWIFKISQFFDYQGIPENERLTVASFYMEGPALSWYQWMCRNGFFPSWPAMLQALESDSPFPSTMTPRALCSSSSKPAPSANTSRNSSVWQTAP